MTQENIEATIAELLNTPGHEEAKEFMLLFNAHCALIDDNVDEEYSVERLRAESLITAKYFNCTYWLKYRPQLLILDRLIHNAYFDSVEWEHSKEEWQRQQAKHYSNSGIWMILAVIFIDFGDDKLREFSKILREGAHVRHKEDKI